MLLTELLFYAFSTKIMEILNSVEALPEHFGPSVVTLGNFDGVHLGHRELFRQLVKTARTLSCLSVVFTFNPHPLKLLAPDRAPLLLNTYAEKQRLIAASHIDLLVEAPFTREFASTSPERFIDEILLDKLQARALIVGYDYAFGKGRSGNAEFLKEYCGDKGVAVTVLKPVATDGVPYSSTKIRNLIADGDVSGVIPWLGRQYNLSGRVVPGYRRGRVMGFPTANLETDKELLPAPGVYVVKARLKQQEFGAVANIGQRPTFAEGGQTVEVHLLDFTGDLYGEEMRIYFIKRLRGEKKFASMDALSNAIAEDVLAARQILPSVQIIQYQEYLSLR